MTKFEVLKGITGVAEFSRLLFDMAEKAESAEELEKDLRTEVPESGLKIIESIARSGNYPLSLENAEDFTDLKHSIRIFDGSGTPLIDIDKTGVINNSNELNVSVCKVIGQNEGWDEVKLIYASEKLRELAHSPRE